MNHVVIHDMGLHGWEYGMLRSFENAIIKETGASIIDLPAYQFASKYQQHFVHGMNRSVYRKYFPKQDFNCSADVAWSILMGPENYRLDLYKNWQKSCKIKILYLYDTMPAQYPLIKRLFSNNTWDVLVTSFNDAADDLGKLTGRRWHCVEQAADENLFHPVPADQRLIHFSSYGRRYPALHDALRKFCEAKQLYYDYTTHDARHPVAVPSDLYRQYAWHLTHSVFTFSWPVEFTNPQRAGHLHPITCRWFEAAASGTVMVGKAPGNDSFKDLFSADAVVNLDVRADEKQMMKQLETIWERREEHQQRALQLYAQHGHQFSWNERVQRILSFIR